MKKKLLDTSAIYRSDLNLSEGGYVTTNRVLDEVRDDTAKSVLNSALSSGALLIEMPSPEYVKKTEIKAKETGDLGRLSDVDLELLALAWEKKYLLVSDDYSIQNMCMHLDIQYMTGSAKGITNRVKWSMICSGCAREYEYNIKNKICPVCGSDLVKKALRS
ncbi:MAG: hypothetical protein B6U97_03065 [Candidatus Altiarchaeales archaeon ex4484_96]|nr:MAG: hypothetical protein B6U97_03065 [Candidatus Altiarchaeales archaeon ex4484_96]